MKKIIVIVSQLRIGGVSKALIALLNSIKDKYDVSLLCFDGRGLLKNEISGKIKIIETNEYLVLTERSSNDLRDCGPKYKLVRLCCSLWAKIFNKRVPAKYIEKKVGNIRGEYDIAIAFGHPMPQKMFCNITSEITLDCIKATKKVIVIHCDYGAYGGHCRYNDSLLKKFDVIAAVSGSVGVAVKRCIPSIANKVTTLLNFHDFDQIRKLAEIDPITYKYKTSLVTVARLSPEKGLLRCVRIIRELRDLGYDLGWHVVGDGPLRNEIINEIRRNSAEEFIVLEGEQDNPYRYIKNADYLFVPSIHEAAPMVFIEAACLSVPILSTDTLSANELVAVNKIGKVCSNDDQSIKKLILDELNNNPMKRIEYIATNELAMKNFERICNE